MNEVWWGTCNEEIKVAEALWGQECQNIVGALLGRGKRKWLQFLEGQGKGG